MNTRLADLREAERLARIRFGIDSTGDPPVAGGQQGEKLVWESAIAERRRLAMAVDQGLVLIPGGVFTMGDRTGAGGRAELPLHRVGVAPFKIGRAPVTRREFMLCAEAGGCRTAPTQNNASDDPRAPMTNVNWYDAQDYVTWLRVRTGENYRLPSEAEWEYAARAGAATNYPWGNAVGHNLANCATCGSAWDGRGPAPVGTFAPNAFGLLDVVGNVWQWTADCWYSDFSSAPSTSAARDDVACQNRVLRGGSWDNDAWMARVSYRSGAPAGLRQDINGFRIAKSVE
jgi:formylglycine-generating enzyme required for sulfatase activity